MKINKKMQFFARQLRHKVNREISGFFSDQISCPDKIFIMGNQKSGTSAIASLLAMASEKTYCIDIFVKMASYESKILDGDYLFEDFVSEASFYFKKEIVKEPEFIFFYDELNSLFPKSTFINIVRDPFSNIRSILNRLKLTASDAEKITNLTESLLPENPLWDLLVDTNRMPYRGRNMFEMLVSRWQYAVNIRPNFVEKNFLTVRYEDFLQDKINFINDLCVSLGLEIKKDVSPYLNVNFQPKGIPVAKENFFSKEQIDFIYENCSEDMKRYDYN
jgi:hypothetical protein